MPDGARGARGGNSQAPVLRSVQASAGPELAQALGAPRARRYARCVRESAGLRHAGAPKPDSE
eukprot:7628495-Alexandrium_andersonii.AAC.1